MLSRFEAISHLNAYGVPFDEEKWQSEATRKQGEFGIFAIIIRVIAGLFILAMVIVSVAGLIALFGLENSWQHVAGAIGVLATSFAAWKFRFSYQELEKQYSFRGLLYLSLLLVGKACLLAALFGWFDTYPWSENAAWKVAVIFALITVASCVLYRMYLEAFLAILVSLFLLDTAFGTHAMQMLVPLENSLNFNSGDETQKLQFWTVWQQVTTVSIALLLGVSAILIRWQKSNYLSSVYLYAVLLYLAYKVLPSENQHFWFFAPKQTVDLPANWTLSLVWFVAATALYTVLTGGWQKLKSLEHAIVICCILILAALGMQGVLFAIALMAFGHVRHDRVLWVIGLIYVPVYLFLFYFSLDVTLLTKSYMLLGSGIFILAARFVLMRFFNTASAEGNHA